MAGQAKHPLIKTGKKSGGYNADPHGGNPGRGQNLLPPAVGENYNKPLRGASKGIVGDGPNGKGYQTSAHSDAHHYHGEAVGQYPEIRPMNYRTTLHSEKANSLPVEGANGKALHHPHMGEPHRFANNKSGDGYGHSAAHMKGALRMSGHPKAHRLGCK